MTTIKKLFPIAGVILLQLIMTQVVTFLFSFLFPDMETTQRSHPVIFALFLGITFSIGVFLVGWLALRWGWPKAKPRIGARLVGTLVGACLPLLVALVVYPALEAGNPFFLVSILACIAGFHIPSMRI